jgi:hypothetical protein
LKNYKKINEIMNTMEAINKFAGRFIVLDPGTLSLLFALAISSLTLISCKKLRYEACFSVDKHTYNIGDTVTFKNCSNFDGGYTTCNWSFGDGKYAYTTGLESVTHSYGSSGQFEIRLSVGEKENNSEQTKTINVK